MYIIRSGDVYVTVEPVLHPGKDEFPVTFAWTNDKAAAVRFPTRWHAKVVAKKLPGCVIVRVPV